MVNTCEIQGGSKFGPKSAAEYMARLVERLGRTAPELLEVPSKSKEPGSNKSFVTFWCRELWGEGSEHDHRFGH